jgi:hypothetical protein
MKPLTRGLLIAAIQVALVGLLGARLHYDRATRPRVWALTAPVDPDLPIRGRYVQLRLVVEPLGITAPGPDSDAPLAVGLHATGDRLVAEARAGQTYDPGDLHVIFVERGGRTLAVLDRPLAFFIPEHVTDPSIRPENEELWVEVTLPGKGPPRPIRLGVRRDSGPIEPLEIS